MKNKYIQTMLSGTLWKYFKDPYQTYREDKVHEIKKKATTWGKQ